jgi:hypothetical protein
VIINEHYKRRHLKILGSQPKSELAGSFIPAEKQRTNDEQQLQGHLFLGATTWHNVHLS